ncbi:MAG: hypothetical protein M0R48_03100 [Candidatus Omnitrophica bacterium]|jgi:predicted PP-loop superfamily ATPase|nr:hypothetical protein [Candidatus Omnitrophota bacterium]
MENNFIIKRCKRCGLPSAYPGILLNANKTCNYCSYFDLYKDREIIIKRQLKEDFTRIINNVKRKNNKYDCIVAYSGGKDSSFLLSFLKKKFKLKILAHTLDHSFTSAQAFVNIKKITKALKIDSKITKPDIRVMKELFRFALTENIPYPKEILAMMSQVCAVCWGMVFGTTIHLATQLKIPLMCIGFTPGQYPSISLENFLKVESCLFLSKKVYKDDPMDVIKILTDPIIEKFGEKVRKYYFRSQYIPNDLFVPKILLPFHVLIDYDEKTILKEITNLGWIKPSDTDSCSTNCLINTLSSYITVNKNGYHPYIGELSQLVREGKIKREEAIEAEKIEKESYAMKFSCKKLKLNKHYLIKR